MLAMGATDADKATFPTLKTAFDTYFQVRYNTVYERAYFNKRVQHPGETAEEFIVAVHSMADRCEFGDFRDTLVRNRLVVGIRNVALSEKLQLNAALTLADAVNQIRQREAVHGQQILLREGDSKNDPIVLDALKANKHRAPRRKQLHFAAKQPAAAKKQCGRCGGTPHLSERLNPANETSEVAL